MDARLWHFLGSQRVELKARPFFLLALRADRHGTAGFFQKKIFFQQSSFRPPKGPLPEKKPTLGYQRKIFQKKKFFFGKN